MSKRKTSIEQRLSAEHRRLLNEKLLEKNDTDKDLREWVNSLDDSYNISSSAFGRYTQVFHDVEESLNTLSDEERRLVLRTENQLYIKRLIHEKDGIRVISDNPVYPEWLLSKNDDFEIIGKKVWQARWD